MPVETQLNRLTPEDIFGLLQEISHEENLEDAVKILTSRGLYFFNSTMAGIWLYNDKKFHSLSISARTEQQEQFLINFLPPDIYTYLSTEAEGGTIVPKITVLEIDEQGHEINPRNNNTSYLQSWSENLREFAIRRILYAPLIHFGQMYGLMIFLSTELEAYDEESVYWLEQLMPLVSANVYEQQMRMAALEREQALSLLLRGTEILVKAVSEDQLLAEAGEMAMELLYLEAGFFYMMIDGEWNLSSPFGRFKHIGKVWQEWIDYHRHKNSPAGYVPSPEPSVIILKENELEELPCPVKKMLVYPIVTHRGIVGEMWLLDSGTKVAEKSQDLLSAFVRMLAMSLETIRQRQELRHLATTDSLTGILNRQGFEQRIVAEMANTLRRGTAFQFLLLDLDGFKSLNDTQGHPAGDLALVHVAQNLQRSVRLGDIVGRTGGDEFAVVLTDLPAGAVAMRIIERLKTGLELEKYGMGVSIGVAEFPTEAKDYETLYKVSDSRLYIGKQNGKGQIITGEVAPQTLRFEFT